MAKFARNILGKATKVTRGLVGIMRETSARFQRHMCLHSGIVTGTHAYTPRMCFEALILLNPGSVAGKIHLSQATADELFHHIARLRG
jgi:hypothetical protein